MDHRRKRSSYGALGADLSAIQKTPSSEPLSTLILNAVEPARWYKKRWKWSKVATFCAGTEGTSFLSLRRFQMAIWSLTLYPWKNLPAKSWIVQLTYLKKSKSPCRFLSTEDISPLCGRQFTLVRTHKWYIHAFLLPRRATCLDTTNSVLIWCVGKKGAQLSLSPRKQSVVWAVGGVYIYRATSAEYPLHRTAFEFSNLSLDELLNGKVEISRKNKLPAEGPDPVHRSALERSNSS